MGTLTCLAGCLLMVVGILGALRSGRAEQGFEMLVGEAGSCPSSQLCLRCLRLPVSPPFQSSWAEQHLVRDPGVCQGF